MPIELNKQEHDEAIHSLKRYFSEEMDQDLSDLRARLLLEYFLKEIGPFSYNQGVQDAAGFIRRGLEDASATCFEQPLTHWRSKKQ